LVLLAAALLPGCGSSSGPKSADAPLRFWNGFTGPDGKTMERMVRNFERETGIRVDMQIIPWATYYDKVVLTLAFSDAPDVFICHANQMPMFAKYGKLHSLNALMSGPQGLPDSDFMELPWKAVHYGGQQLGLPLDAHPLGLYYNRTMFEKAGIVDGHGQAKPPTTWDEFLADARKLTLRDTGGKVTQWGFTFTNLRSNWYTFLRQFGGNVLSADQKRCELTSPQSLAASERMHDLIDKYRVSPKPEGFDAWEGFRKGQVAMIMEGIYMLSGLEEQKGLRYGGAPVPLFGTQRAAWGGSHVLVMPVNEPPERVDKVWRFMKYLSDHSLEWARGGQTPIRKSLIASPVFRTMPIQRAFATQVPYLSYEPLTVVGNEIAPFFDAAVQSMLIDVRTVPQAMKRANRQIQTVLNRS
jgi:multiple sugar transport system substrate-binding protein